MTLHPIPLNFLIYEGNFLFFFISAFITKLLLPSTKYLPLALRMKAKEQDGWEWDPTSGNKEMSDVVYLGCLISHYEYKCGGRGLSQ